MEKNLDSIDRLHIHNEQQVIANCYYMKAMAEYDFRGILPQITVPVLLEFAVPGSIYFEKVGRYVEAMVPDTRFLLLEDATYLFNSEQIQGYLQEICKFVRE